MSLADASKPILRLRTDGIICVGRTDQVFDPNLDRFGVFPADRPKADRLTFFVTIVELNSVVRFVVLRFS